MRIQHLLLAAFSFTALASAPALANPREAWQADVEKFCKGVEHGRGRVMKCLKEHESELSAECKAAGEKMKAKMEEKRKEVEAACGDDIKAYCEDIEPGHGRIAICLKSNKDRLSPECKDVAEKIKAKHHKKHHAPGAKGGR